MAVRVASNSFGGHLLVEPSATFLTGIDAQSLVDLLLSQADGLMQRSRATMRLRSFK